MTLYYIVVYSKNQKQNSWHTHGMSHSDSTSKKMCKRRKQKCTEYDQCSCGLRLPKKCNGFSPSHMVCSTRFIDSHEAFQCCNGLLYMNCNLFESTLERLSFKTGQWTNKKQPNANWTSNLFKRYFVLAHLPTNLCPNWWIEEATLVWRFRYLPSAEWWR